jgi:uncharacterized membrane protein (UPF0127 family)
MGRIYCCMNIANVTRGSTLATRARRAGSFAARARGLMMAPPLPDSGGLVIEPCNSIHMFFMRYPLDIVFLDKEGRVVFMYRGIKPWRMGRVVKGARLAIELPEGAVDRSRTQIGDRIEMS